MHPEDHRERPFTRRDMEVELLAFVTIHDIGSVLQSGCRTFRRRAEVVEKEKDGETGQRKAASGGPRIIHRVRMPARGQMSRLCGNVREPQMRHGIDWEGDTFGPVIAGPTCETLGVKQL